MRRLATAFLALLSLASSARAGVVFDVLPSGPGPANGIQFSPLGGDLVVTDTLTRRGGDATPLYLDFGAAYERTDAAGNVFYLPRTDIYQLYILDHMLASPDPSSLGVVAGAVLVGESEAVALGGGRYRYSAGFLGTTDFARGILDEVGSVDLTFNLNLPLGYQVESGSVTFAGTVPEPGSAWLVAGGLGLGLAARMSRRDP